MGQFNNNMVTSSGTTQRVLDAINEGEQVRSDTIAKRVGLSRCTVCIHLGRLMDAKKVTKVRVNKYLTYSRAVGVKRPTERSSLRFAGYREPGMRGYANW